MITHRIDVFIVYCLISVLRGNVCKRMQAWWEPLYLIPVFFLCFFFITSFAPNLTKHLLPPSISSPLALWCLSISVAHLSSVCSTSSVSFSPFSFFVFSSLFLLFDLDFLLFAFCFFAVSSLCFSVRPPSSSSSAWLSVFFLGFLLVFFSLGRNSSSFSSAVCSLFFFLCSFFLCFFSEFLPLSFHLPFSCCSWQDESYSSPAIT